MVGKTMLTTMFDYNATTNAQLLARAANVSDEELDAPTDFPHRTLRATFYHYLTVEWAWRTVSQTHTSPTAPPAVEQASSVVALQAFAENEAQRARAFVAGLSEEDLAADFTTERQGRTHQFTLWKTLVHMLYHSAQHRSEVAAMLTRYGQSPGDTDFLFFAYPDLRPQ